MILVPSVVMSHGAGPGENSSQALLDMTTSSQSAARERKASELSVAGSGTTASTRRLGDGPDTPPRPDMSRRPDQTGMHPWQEEVRKSNALVPGQPKSTRTLSPESVTPVKKAAPGSSPPTGFAFEMGESLTLRS